MQWSSIRICLEKKLGTIGDDLWERDEKISEEETRWWNLSSLKRRSCKLSGGPILKGPRTRWFLFPLLPEILVHHYEGPDGFGQEV
jgi:hypothetical protein